MEKQVSKQAVLAVLKKADVLISTIAPSSSKYLRFDGVVVEPCSESGKQEFVEVATRVKGRKGQYHNSTKKVVVEQIVRISNHVNRFDEHATIRLEKAIKALQAAGFIVRETKVASYQWNGLVEESFFLVSKAGA